MMMSGSIGLFTIFSHPLVAENAVQIYKNDSKEISDIPTNTTYLAQGCMGCHSPSAHQTQSQKQVIDDTSLKNNRTVSN